MLTFPCSNFENALLKCEIIRAKRENNAHTPCLCTHERAVLGIKINRSPFVKSMRTMEKKARSIAKIRSEAAACRWSKFCRASVVRPESLAAGVRREASKVKSKQVSVCKVEG